MWRENETPEYPGSSSRRGLIVVPKSCFRRAKVAAAKIVLGGRLLALQGGGPGVGHRAVEDLVHRPECALSDRCDNVHGSSLTSMATGWNVGICRRTDCAAAHTAATAFAFGGWVRKRRVGKGALAPCPPSLDQVA